MAYFRASRLCLAPTVAKKKDQMKYLLILSLLAGPMIAEAWVPFWQTADQQGQHFLKKNQFELAAHHFKDPAWQGIAYYQAQNYTRAVQAFSQDKSPRGYYNLGNAEAQLYHWQEALKAYDQALALDPRFKPAIHNKACIENWLNQDNAASHATNEDTPSSTNTNNQPPPTPGNQSHQASQDKTHMASDPENAPSNTQAFSSQKKANPYHQEDKQFQAQWLQMLPDGTGNLLENQFLQAHLHYEALRQAGEAPW